VQRLSLGMLLVTAILVSIIMSTSAWATQNDLGSANQFGILSFAGSVEFGQSSELYAAYVSTPPASCPGQAGCPPATGAVNIGLSFHDSLAGDAIASRPKGVAILMGPADSAAGECVTGGGVVLLGALSACVGGIDQSGTNSKATTLLPDANTDAAAFAQTLAGLTATQTLAAIALNTSQNYSITAAAGLNVIALPSIVTKGNNTITITASADDTVVINIGSAGTPGELLLGPSTQILLSGGITPDRVVFNVVGDGYPVTIDRGSIVNGTILAPGDEIIVAAEFGSNSKNYSNGTIIYGALLAGKDICIGCLVKIYFYPLANIPVTQGGCLQSSSLAVLVQGTNVTAYVPKSAWFSGTTGVSAIQIEGSGTTPTLIPTAENVNSCASNPATGQTVCVSNGIHVYILSGTSLVTTLTDGASTLAGFSGGECETCGVAMNPATNQAVLTEGTSAGDGFQFLDLTPLTFENPFASPSGDVSEEVLIDPTRNLLLSPSEDNDYEIVNIASTSAPAFYENPLSNPGGEFDSAAEDCSTGIALASDELTSNLFIADLTQASFTPGSPAGTWTSAEALDNFPEFAPFATTASGTTGISVAQGTHIGIVTSEFGGNWISAIRLPATSGSGTPSLVDDVACQLPSEPNGDVFEQGLDPHTVTAYLSPNSGDAIGLSADGGSADSGVATYVAVIDLTKLLNTSIVPRISAHTCDPAVNLATAGVVSYVAVP
jgi:choice-of-anchor A domain-containing protein